MSPHGTGTASFYLPAVSDSSIWPIHLFALLSAVAVTSGSNTWAIFGYYSGMSAYGRLRRIAQLPPAARYLMRRAEAGIMPEFIPTASTAGSEI